MGDGGRMETESEIDSHHLKVKFVVQWGRRLSCSTGFYHSSFLLCWERASPEGTILKTAAYFTKQWSFPGEPCVQLATSVEGRKKYLPGSRPFLMSHVMKACVVPIQFIVHPFKNKSHVTLLFRRLFTLISTLTPEVPQKARSFIPALLYNFLLSDAKAFDEWCMNTTLI